MTDHEMLLLRAAVEACDGVYCGKTDDGSRYFASRDGALDDPDSKVFFGPTLAPALTALLRDLGAEVPEWPSEPQMMNVGMALIEYGITEEQVAVLGSFPLPEYLALRGGS